MKKLLIILMLISPFSFADWGDIYYCQMTNFSEEINGKIRNRELGKFQFILDKTKNAMVFGKGGYYLRNGVHELDDFFSQPSKEIWYSTKELRLEGFIKGRFYHFSVYNRGSTSISADCDKF